MAWLRITVIVSILYLSATYSYWVGCRTRKDCPEHAHCNLNLSVCFCDTNYVLVQREKIHTCLQVGSEVGARCENDVQCQVGLGKLSACRNSLCTCTDQAHYFSGVCYRSALMGEKCNVTSECVVRRRGMMAYCDIHETGVCICPPGHHPSPDRADCIPDTALGDPCSHDEDCTGSFAECKRVCVCKSEFTRSLNKTTCLPVATRLGEKCLENPQCSARIPNSRCHSGNLTCICLESARLNNNTCSISVPLGGYCQGPGDCVIRSRNSSRVACLSGICSCSKGFKPWRDDCVDSGAVSWKSNEYLPLLIMSSYIASLIISNVML